MILYLSERLDHYWFFKYKIYHVFFWAIYLFMWGVIEVGFAEAVDGIFNSARFSVYLAHVLIDTCAVYISLYYLLPKYLERGEVSKYITYVFLLVVVAGLIIFLSFFICAAAAGKDMDYFCGFGKNPSFYDMLQFYLTRTFSNVAGAILLSLSIKLVKNWSKTKKRQQELEKEKLETELKFLKSQFNPHFLFNSINSIFFLIRKDPDVASDALAKFSDLLRYQLYECNEQQIPLSNELAYMKNFVALEKLRRNKNFQVNLAIDQQKKGHLGIAPFILMTFVENAFKHVSSYKYQTNWIDVTLRIVDDNLLTFEIINSTAKEEHTTEAVQYGGIGLANVQRRLELIYPEQYELNIESEEGQFTAKLQLRLSEIASTQQEIPDLEKLSKTIV